MARRRERLMDAEASPADMPSGYHAALGLLFEPPEPYFCFSIRPYMSPPYAPPCHVPA